MVPHGLFAIRAFELLHVRCRFHHPQEEEGIVALRERGGFVSPLDDGGEED